MESGSLQLIPSRKGVAACVARGENITVVNTHGGQVVDTWAFRADDATEYMSMEHTRPTLLRLRPLVGDRLLTNHRRPILTVVADTSGGAHDMLIAACDRHRYEQLGYVGHHDSCTDNLRASLAPLGITPTAVPCPLNLFMNVPVGPDGSLTFAPSPAQPGARVTFRAELDAIIVFSACPQDLVPVNGVDCLPKSAQYFIDDSQSAI